MNIANCYFEKKDFIKARNYYQRILKTFYQLKDSSQIVLAYINLGNISSNLDNGKEAFYYFNRATELLQTYKNQSFLSTTYLELGSLYYKLENNAMARKYLELCLQNSSGNESKSNSMQALQHLSMIEEKEGNSSMAFHYFKQYISIKDSIMNDETHKKIAEIQWKYDFHKKVYENELLQKKYEIKKRQNTIIALASASVILVVLMLTGLIFLANRNLKKSVRLKELDNNILQEKIKTDEKISALEKFRYQTEIEARNKEMTTTSLQLAAKNEILSNILHTLDKINEVKSIEKESYKELRKTIEKSLNLDNDWNQFKELFDRVHNSFFISIKQICPRLSETELRFCAYLRINLQNKEIAKMLNISTETVKTTRYRIRKKLNLDNKTNLEDFIRNI
jgi:DNA-binding CsgD family transcriptional regulator